MVILGLGSNIGDRLMNLRNAYKQLLQIPELKIHQVSPVYISDALMPENAPKDWDLPYLNFALRCETSLSPLALLDKIKNIEETLGRKSPIRHWGPRMIDIDILVWDQEIMTNERLNIPHINLLDRPFALWPLSDVSPFWCFPHPGPDQGKTAAELVEKWGSRFSGEAPFRTRQIYQRIENPQLVGILNITPDSYSDGGKYFQADAAVKQMKHLIESGADVIDIGAESTSPNATAITPEQEWERLEPVLVAIKSELKNPDLLLIPKISIDTRHAEVAAKALEFGIDWINDQSGLDDPAMQELIANSKADCVIMHHLSLPERRDNVLPRGENPVKKVMEWAEKRLEILEKKGIASQRCIFDPGIGFGKMAEQSFSMLQHIPEFHSLGLRLLIGHSRKTFLSLFTSLPFAERDAETMAIAILLVKQPVDYLRVHNVEICARGLKVAAAL